MEEKRGIRVSGWLIAAIVLFLIGVVLAVIYIRKNALGGVEILLNLTEDHRFFVVDSRDGYRLTVCSRNPFSLEIDGGRFNGVAEKASVLEEVWKKVKIRYCLPKDQSFLGGKTRLVLVEGGKVSARFSSASDMPLLVLVERGVRTIVFDALVMGVLFDCFVLLFFIVSKR